MYRLLYLLFLSTVYAVEKKEIKDPEEKIVSFKKYGLQFTDEVAFSNPQSLNYEDAVDDEEATFGDAYDENLGLLPQYMLHRHGIDKGWVHVPIFPKKGISWSTTPLPAALNDNREWGFTTRLPPEPPVISSDWDRAAETELRKDPSDNYFNGWRRTDQESTPPPWHPPATVRWILVPSTTEEPITTTTTTPETAPPTPEPEPSPMRETGPSNFEHLPRVTPGLDGFQSRETFASQSQTAPTQSPVQEPSAPVFSVNNNFFQPTATQETTTEPTTTEGTTVPAWVTRRRLFFNTFPTTIPPWVTRQHRLFFTTTPGIGKFKLPTKQISSNHNLSTRTIYCRAIHECAKLFPSQIH
ncbi:hypothetical protein WR25_08690 [Diploscapter pachys]|uniref:Uncharacterized protein n=1 Tax=Diploscapter pachys TaxID=2018661 RepID=A0A2A2LB92_9BILA|nr:hypothetical protein WR25_08690 [Diploscapter pachys]